MSATQSQIISKIVALIKRRRAEAIKFITAHGVAIKNTDSDVNIGKAISLVMSKADSKTRQDFVKLLDPSLKADGDAASDAAFYTQGGVGTPKTTTTVSAPAVKTSSSGSTFGSILGGVTGLFTTASTNKAAAQQSSDAITLAIINAGIQKQKTPTSTIIAIVVLAVIVIGVFILLYLKSKK